MNVSLREITRKNYEAVCELEIPYEQQRRLSENTWSLVEIHYHDTHHVRAICRDDEVVRFMMLVHMSASRNSIWRFMMAHEHRKRGIGRDALQQAVREIRERNGLKEFEICYSPDNTIAWILYLSVGFKKARVSDDESEVYAIIAI